MVVIAMGGDGFELSPGLSWARFWLALAVGSVLFRCFGPRAVALYQGGWSNGEARKNGS